MGEPIHSLSHSRLAAMLARGEVSPVEVTEAVLARIKERDGELNTYITVDEAGARAMAQEAAAMLARGEATPLTGIPLALKDVMVTRGLRTTCGSRILANFIPPYDATVCARLRRAGAVFLGKVNMDEFAMGSSTENSAFGPSRNPWNRDYIPGGSSGGSAAAVAADLCIASLGSDTGGSIRQPASLCGVVGLKPTYGRVSRYGLVAYASSLDQIGPLTKDVRDAAILLQAIAGHDPKDSTSVAAPVPDYQERLGQEIEGMKIGVPREFFGAGLDPEVAAAVQEALQTLTGLGAELVEISLPHTEYAVAVYYVLAVAEASSNLSRFDGVRYGYRAPDYGDLADMYEQSRSQGFGSEVKRRIMIGTYVLSHGYYDAYYIQAQKIRRLIAQDFVEAYKHCDVIMGPTAPSTAFRLGEKGDDPVQMYLSDIYTIAVNLAGLPGMSIPCGFGDNDMPVGLQIIGNYFDEARMLNVAHQYQLATDWHSRAPQL